MSAERSDGQSQTSVQFRVIRGEGTHEAVIARQVCRDSGIAGFPNGTRQSRTFRKPHEPADELKLLQAGVVAGTYRQFVPVITVPDFEKF